MGDLRIGIAGLDTSHVVAFTGILNNKDGEHHVPGGCVVGAFKGGNPAYPLSRDRVDGFTEKICDEFKVPLYDSIGALVADTDALLLESVDGGQHLEQFREAAQGKPVFIDKPIAMNLADTREIFRIAEETGTPVMSSSSLRYAAGIADVVEDRSKILACEAYGPGLMPDGARDLFWYGIHTAEMLFAMMGSGCEHVRHVALPDTDMVVGTWTGNRAGIFRITRLTGYDPFGCLLHTADGMRHGVAANEPPHYVSLLKVVVEFFRTRQAPITAAETLEIVAFLEAAEESCRQKGAEVRLAS